MGASRGWPVTLKHGELTVRPLRYLDRNEFMSTRSRNWQWLQPWEATSPNPGVGASGFYDLVYQLRKQARAAQSMPFVLTTADEQGRQKLIGQLSVGGMMWGSAMSASIGYWIDQDYAGRGFTPLAVALVSEHLFYTVGFHRVEINIRPENERSLAVVHKLGFRDEGIRKQYLHINGAWADHRTFALLKEELTGSLVERLGENTRQKQ